MRAVYASTNSCGCSFAHAGQGERVHAHAALGPVRREIAREVVERRLRNRVRDRLEERLAARAPEVVELLDGREHSVDRGDVHDRAAACFRHRARRRPGRRRSVPFTFTCHDLVERLRGIVLERADLLGGRVGRRVERRRVDEHVRHTPGRDSAVARSIAPRSVTSTTKLLMPSPPRPRCRRSPRFGPRAASPRAISPPELARAAGHDGDPALEREEIAS